MISILQSKDIDKQIALKKRPNHLLPKDISFTGKDEHTLKVKDCKEQIPRKKSKSVVISEKANFKSKLKYTKSSLYIEQLIKRK
jgi:hypothetical protein